MTFKLRIPGRDYIEAVTAANPANPLIRIEAANEVLPAAIPFPPISGLAGSEVCNDENDAKVERSAIISADDVPYWQADEMAGLRAWTDAEITTFEKRQARVTWLGSSR